MKKIKVEKSHTYKGHSDCLYTLESIDSQSFISGGGDGMIVKWDVENPDNGELIVKIPASVYALSFEPNRKILVVGQNFSGIHLIDVEHKKEIRSVELTKSQIFDIQTTEHFILVATGDGEIIILNWDLQIVNRQKLSTKSARSIAISIERQQFAIGYSDHMIRIFDISNFKLIKELEAHANSVFTLQYHPELPVLLSAGRDARIKFWDLDRDFELLEEIVAHMFTINHLTFSPDNQHFVSCSMDKSIKIWDARSFKLLKVIDKARHAGHGTSVNKLLWLSYQAQLLSCSDDRTISQWNINFAIE
ncbi:MAG: WD40 repeat domain-containing protein [Cyclobacteriaceae bacterium]